MKNILIVDLCYEKDCILFDEFVLPIINIVKKNPNISYDIIHMSELKHLAKYISKFNKIIICGTGLKDFEYMNNLKSFNFLKTFEGDVLGICAGSQIIGKLFGEDLIQCEEIGIYNLKIMKEDALIENINLDKIYTLHKQCIDIKDEYISKFKIIARTNKCPQILKLKEEKRNMYAILFHPEVRCEELINNFINM